VSRFSFSNLKFNSQLSDIFTRLWELDVEKCKPDIDYKLDLQGYVTTTKMTGKDWASRHLFTWVKEDKVFAKPTYKAFFALLDNYESDTTKPEEVTPQEEEENWHFIDLVMETSVMKEAHQFLINNNKASADASEFKKTLYKLWFKMYKRLFGDHAVNSCGFEHVFVGETRGHEVTGFHNWIQFYLQEKKGRVDYRGYFRRGTTEEFEKSPRIMTLQFIWNRSSAKPIGSSFIGTSPEFEMALYTVMFLMNEEDVLVKIKKYDVELICHKHGQGIGTAFPMSKSD